jgi:hypothetical protein
VIAILTQFMTATIKTNRCHVSRVRLADFQTISRGIHQKVQLVSPMSLSGAIARSHRKTSITVVPSLYLVPSL